MTRFILLSIFGFISLASIAQSETLGQKIDELTYEWDTKSAELNSYDGLAQFCSSLEYRTAFVEVLHDIHHYDSVLYGRLVKEKEIVTLMRVYRLFQERDTTVKFVVVGDGPGGDKLREKMPNALFLGRQTGENLWEAFASCDIFVFPSLTETFGNVVLEALSSGLPVVTAQAGGPKDIVQDGVTGYHVTPKEPEEFYQKINHLLKHDDEYEELRKNAIAYAETQTWERVCGELYKIYEDYLNKGTTKD
jgi:glycosyltransferase involved in cell wall biosynthesis